jgi:predicted ABC-type exoprotein transport system permease subunit
MVDAKIAYLVLDATSWFMTGLIWFVQIVHYPLFANVGATSSKDYAQLHCNLTGSVVVVPMMIQATTALGLAIFADPQNAFVLWVNFAMIAIIWVVTALFSVPSHSTLCNVGYNEKAHKTLLRANWARTILWTVCSLLVTTILYKKL